VVDEYRVFFLDDEGKYVRFVGLTGDNDVDVIAQARRLRHKGPLEIWRHGHFVAKLDGLPPSTQPDRQDRAPRRSL
jgi:hypothetical protein